jgi:SAM-dependent methyltransferase
MAGDMASLPLQSGSCNVILAASCLNLVPEYERPLVILEMLRCLTEDGEVIVTGPNERFSAEDYIKCTVASNLERYLLPWNMAQAQNLGQVGTIIDDLVKERLDCSYLPTEAFCETLQLMDCRLQKLEHWPQQGSEPSIFSGMRFKATAETKRRLQRYERQRHKELAAEARRQVWVTPHL